MARQPLPIGSHGKLYFIEDGGAYIARTQFRDLDGVVRQVKRRGKSRAAAERALRVALTQRQAPLRDALVSPDTRFSKVAELWFAELEAAVDDGRRSPGTMSTYRSVYRVSVEPALGALRIREVTTPMVDRFLSAVKASSTSGAKTAKVVVSGVMRFAARHGAVTHNPVREVARIDSKPRKPPRALTATERQAWIDVIDADSRARMWDLPDLTRMMLATGCRIGECLAIGWTEVDLDAATLDVRWHLVRRKGVGLLRLPTTKSGADGERLLPLPLWAVDMLRSRRALIGPTVEPVFPDSIGGWRDPSNVLRVWRDVRDRAEMAGLVTHTMRKTVASVLDDARVSTRKISDQLGHSKISMTQDHYIGRRLTDRQTADILEGLFGPTADENRPNNVPGTGAEGPQDDG